VKADVVAQGTPGAAEEGQRRGPNAHVLERARASQPIVPNRYNYGSLYLLMLA
jgi:hypothetical protein